MTLATIFVPNLPSSSGAQLTVEGPELHHLHVRRVKVGERIRLIDGSGGAWFGEVERISARRASVRVLGALPHCAESPLDTTLVLAVVRAERLEYALEKATELGAHQIVLFRAKYSRNYDAEARLPRWQRVVQESSKQCQRARVPALTLLPSLESLVLADEPGLRLVCDIAKEPDRATWPMPPSPRPRAATIVVGPEGGLAEEELTFLAAKGFAPVSLGPRILRTETAVTVALTLAQFLWGDLSPAARLGR
ncbi:MAG: ribosomal RNA small subunit methyltransferase E [Candidatus Binatia bacterium]|nr:MAG: ribosomal RNA small subunit methyltransferase E [Candidatus Binatia bacterium]